MVNVNTAVTPILEKNVAIDVKSLRLERTNWFDSSFKIAIINPLLNYVFTPRVVKFFQRVTRNHIVANLNGPGSWKSMLAHYGAAPQSMFDFMIDRYVAFPSGLRNRQKLVVCALTQLMEAYGKNQTVHLVAIGCGSGNNILKSVEIEKSKVAGIKAQLIDLNQEALNEGKIKCHEMGLDNEVEFICADANQIESKISAPPQIVKMIGLVEYLSDESVIRLLESIKKFRAPASSILISSIEPGHGIDRFLRRTLNFNLNYRGPEKLKMLLQEFGYTRFNVFSEPTGIFNVIVGHA